jgi:hypothetical protein
MDRFFSRASQERSLYEAQIPLMQNDPKDRHVLALAVASESEMLVTENKKDFPDSSTQDLKVQVLSSDEFLQHLLKIDAQKVIFALQKRAAELKNPPYTFEEFLDKMAQFAPITVNIIKAELNSQAPG